MPFAIQVQWQPAAAIQSLSAQDRHQVQVALTRLAEGQFNGTPQVYRIRGYASEPEYHVLRVNQSLRLLFTIDQARQVIVIHDLISHEFARRYG